MPPFAVALPSCLGAALCGRCWTQLFDRVTDEWFEVEDLASECLVTWRWRQ